MLKSFSFFFLHLGSHAALFWSHQEWSISCKLVLQSWNSLGVSRFKSLFIRRCLQVDLASNSADSDPLNSANDLCYWLSGFQSLYVCSSVCLTFCPCDYPFVCLFVFLFVCLCVCPSFCRSVCLSTPTPAYLPICLCVHHSVFLIGKAMIFDLKFWTAPYLQTMPYELITFFSFFLRSLKRLSEAEAMLKKAIR